MRQHVAQAYLATLDPNKYALFAEEVGSNDKRLCIVNVFDEFIKRFLRNRYQYFNECIDPLKPCRLFIDADEKWDGIPSLQVQLRYVQDIQVAVQQRLGYEVLEPPVVLTSSRERKFSLHLIWTNVWFEHAAQLKSFMAPIALQKIGGVGIDEAVYPTHAVTFLRMPYNRKKKSNSPLVPLGGNPEFSLDIFCASVLTFHSGHGTCPLLLPTTPFVHVDSTLIPRTYPSLRGEIEGPMHDTMGEVIRWMTYIYPLFKENRPSASSEGFVFTTPYFCHIADRWHKSNPTFINCDKQGRVTRCCCDGNCRVRFDMPFSAHQVVRSTIAVSIDWRYLPTEDTVKKSKLM